MAAGSGTGQYEYRIWRWRAPWWKRLAVRMTSSPLDYALFELEYVERQLQGHRP